MDKFIIIDTCVWVNLASEPKLHSLLEVLDRTLKEEKFVLILPTSVKTEFDRHRAKIKKDWNQKIKGHIGTIKQLKKHFPDQSHEITKIHNILQDCRAKSDSNIEDNLQLVEQIFKKGRLLDNCLDEMMAESAKRVFYQISPAQHPKGSSVGDCLLWLSILDALKNGEVWFCTDNIHDFSEKNAPNLLQRELDKEVGENNHKGVLNYFIDPNKFITQLCPDVQELPRYLEYYELDKYSWMKPTLCPTCNQVSAIVQVYNTGYRYFCNNCKIASPLIPSDDKYL